MLKHHNDNSSRPARVVILGANGFIGRKLVERFGQEKIETLALGRDRLNLAADKAGELLTAELRPNDALVFLAAITPDKGRGIEPFVENMKMGVAVCAALAEKSVAHVVYVSSDAVYPFRQGLIDETSCAEPSDLYAAMHIAREIMMKQACKMPFTILRPTLIFGATDTHNSYGPNRLRRMARNDGRIVLFGEGEETRDYIFIDDAVTLISLVIEHRSEGLLNLATGRSVSYAALARMISELYPSSIEIETTPRQNPITHRSFDVSALHRSFPLFRFTSLEVGLAMAHGGKVT